jgi:hypothetical protein
MVLGRLRGKFWLFGVSLLTLSGCSTSADQAELARVQSASSAYSTSVQTLRNPPSAQQNLDNLEVGAAVLSGKPVYIDTRCDQDYVSGYQAYVSSLNQSQDAQDRAYRAMIDAVRPCSKLVGPDAGPPGVTPAGPEASSPPAAAANGQAKQDVKDVTTALQTYFTNLQTIVNSTDVAKIKVAATSISESGKTLATTLKAPPELGASLDLLDKIAEVALEQMQYNALRKVVLAIDPLLKKAAPQLIAGLRVSQGKDIQYAAHDASGAAALLTGVLKNPKLKPEQRFEVYKSLSPNLENANSVYLSLASEDPDAVVNSLVRAHSELASVLRTNKHQTAGIIATAGAIADDGKAIADAANE